MRAIGWLVLSAACTPWVDAERVEEPTTAPGAVAGRYDGTAVLEVRAYAGPVRVARDVCDVPVTLRVDGSARWLVSGLVACDLEQVGALDVEVVGDSVGMPYLEGTVLADEVDGSWDGWFTAPDALYGELAGSSVVSGIRLEYQGYMDAMRTGPVSDAP